MDDTSIKRCRACLSHSAKETFNLFDNNFIELYKNCTNLQISPDDSHPKNLCEKCYNFLLSLKLFKKTCINSYKTLEEEAVLLNKNTFEYKKDVLPILDNEAEHGCSYEEIVDSYRCEYCHFEFSQKTSLIKHMKKHSAKVKKEYFRCTKCIRWFYTSEKLQGHLRIHEGKKQAECKICGKDFKKWSGLKQHMVQHDGNKKFSCHVCKKLFFFEWNLRAHEKTHSIESLKNTAICDVCGKSFSSLGNLKIHMHVHSEYRPYCCTQCEKKFKLESGLREHLMRHNGIKNFVCPDCGKSFTTHSEMIRHAVLHSDLKPFICNNCKKQFKRKALLINHMKVHLIDRSYRCNSCDKYFNNSTLLIEHRRSHNQDSFICNSCNKTIPQFRSFKKHVKNCKMNEIIND